MLNPWNLQSGRIFLLKLWLILITLEGHWFWRRWRVKLQYRIVLGRAREERKCQDSATLGLPTTCPVSKTLASSFCGTDSFVAKTQITSVEEEVGLLSYDSCNKLGSSVVNFVKFLNLELYLNSMCLLLLLLLYIHSIVLLQLTFITF